MVRIYIREFLETNMIHNLERDLIRKEERCYLELEEQDKLIELRFKELIR